MAGLQGRYLPVNMLYISIRLNSGTRRELLPIFPELIKKEKNNSVRNVYIKAIGVIEKQRLIIFCQFYPKYPKKWGHFITDLKDHFPNRGPRGRKIKYFLTFGVPKTCLSVVIST